MEKVAPAVKKETKRVAIATAVMTVLMWVVFAAGHLIRPEQIPFDYRVILGGIGGAAVAVGNFFLMGLTVQKVANTGNEDDARARMRASYSRRLLLQAVWIVLAIVLPFVQFAAGIAPLLFPSLSIKARSVLPVFRD